MQSNFHYAFNCPSVVENKPYIHQIHNALFHISLVLIVQRV